MLRPLGLHVSRASLEQPPRYTPSPTGRHLAVYAVPLGPYTATDYTANITRVARAFLPQVFQRWSGLVSFDVCQEPLPSVDPDPEAPSVTKLVVTRRGASGIDWAHVTVAELQRGSRTRSGRANPNLYLYIDTFTLSTPPYQPPTTPTS